MYEYKAKVIRVIDGDTFEAEIDCGFSITVTQTLRLRGIDTPETWRPRNELEREHGQQAKELVESLISDREVVILTHKTGKYGRYIADVILENGMNLTDILIENNMEKKQDYT